MNEPRDGGLTATWKTRRLSQTGKILLSEIIPALKALQAGKTLLIEDSSPARIDQIRSHLYTYFSESSQKRYFRTIRETATKLRIICQDLTKSTLTVDFSPIETFVIDNLLSCETLDEAVAITRAAFTAREITDSEFLLIIDEWEARVSLNNVVDAEELKKPRIDPLNGSVEDLEGKGGVDGTNER